MKKLNVTLKTTIDVEIEVPDDFDPDNLDSESDPDFDYEKVAIVEAENQVLSGVYWEIDEDPEFA